MEKKRVYIASKLGSMEPAVRILKETLERIGFQIIYDWTERPVVKPFEKNLAEAAEAAQQMTQAVMQCDILIVLCAEGGIGYHIETGGALVASVILSMVTGQPHKQIYVVGEGNDRSIFYFHPLVKRLPDVIGLLGELADVIDKGKRLEQAR